MLDKLGALSIHGDNTQQTTTRRHVEGERLAFYNKTADSAFWDRQWETKVCLAAYAEALKSKLGIYEKTFNDYLRKKGRIIEAGCGLGQLVLALQARGYNCEGVDWASQTIHAVKELFPALPVREGDVTNLDVPDGFYDAYISLGVMEHAVEGPELFLQEAHRILTPGGIMLVAVPHFHALRRIKAKLGCYRKPRVSDAFYQYAFTPQ